MKIDDSGPAFPVLKQNAFGSIETAQSGISRRDWFAGHALAGICASGPSNEWTNQRLAAEAYALADAMLAASSSSGGQADA